MVIYWWKYISNHLYFEGYKITKNISKYIVNLQEYWCRIPDLSSFIH